LMQMRTIVVAVTLLILTPILGSIVIVASLLGVRDRPDGVYQRCARLWARAVCASAGARITVHGRENAPGQDTAAVNESGPGVVFCSNHVSWFDVLSLAAVVKRYTFIAKKELGEIPIFGRAARAVGIVFIDRAQRKAAFDSYDVVAREVRGGRSVVVCPEGTRGYDYRLRPFKKGPFVLAIAAGVPIVPTVVYGAREVQRKGSMAVHGAPVDVHFLPPVPTRGFGYEQREQLMQVVWNRMAVFLKERYGVESSGGPLTIDPDASAIPSSFI
jgi:1-acyl-sn-glycerol-3-phosphate acyltransferase